jgi:hypothetical protein
MPSISLVFGRGLFLIFSLFEAVVGFAFSPSVNVSPVCIVGKFSSLISGRPGVAEVMVDLLKSWLSMNVATPPSHLMWPWIVTLSSWGTSVMLVFPAYSLIVFAICGVIWTSW